jgi:hypothetical protein
MTEADVDCSQTGVKHPALDYRQPSLQLFPGFTVDELERTLANVSGWPVVSFLPGGA